MSELWQRVARRWSSGDCSPRPGVQPREIEAFEAKYNVLLPPSVREYFLFADGTGYAMVDVYYRFWPLGEVEPVADYLVENVNGRQYEDRFAYPNCFAFADFLIDSHLYAVRLTRDAKQNAPVFRVTCSQIPGEMVSESFLEFMTKYVQDPDSVM